MKISEKMYVSHHRMLDNEYHAELAGSDPRAAVSEYVGYLRRYCRTLTERGTLYRGEKNIAIFAEFCRVERGGR